MEFSTKWVAIKNFSNCFDFRKFMYLALICGTSTCHMSLTEKPCWANGIWGPYKSAVIPNYFLNEGGQSCTGALVDFVLMTHPCYGAIKAKLRCNEYANYSNQ